MPTVEPRAASNGARAAPMPDEAPVTRIFEPSMSIRCLLFASLPGRRAVPAGGRHLRIPPGLEARKGTCFNFSVVRDAAEGVPPIESAPLEPDGALARSQ